MFGKNWLTGNLRFALAICLLLLLLFPTLAAAQGPMFPATIPLPTGFAPEGVATGRGTTFYTGSLSGMGIYRGDLRTGSGAILTAPAGGVFTGMKVNMRSNLLFVAGGPTGRAWIFDAGTGTQVAMLQLAPASFINDVILTRRYAYFTSSFEPAFYRIRLLPGGLPVMPITPERIELTGDWQQPPAGSFGANGIVATPNERYLIIVNTALGYLYRVDAATGVAQQITLQGDVTSVTNGDGLLLQGKTLYVVRNQNNQIVVYDMSSDFLSGQFVRTITDPNFQVPTTIARFGDYLYAVNAKFGVPPADVPNTPYEVVRVRR